MLIAFVFPAKDKKNGEQERKITEIEKMDSMYLNLGLFTTA